MKLRSIVFGLLIGLLTQNVQAVFMKDLIEQNRVPSVRFNMLDLSNLDIDSFEGIENLDLSGVRFLRLNGNHMRKLPKHAFKKVRGAEGLWGLDVSNNKMEEWGSEALVGLKNLRVLVVNRNNLEIIPEKGLTGLPKLKFLSVYKNPMSFEAMKALQKQVPRAYIWNGPITKENLKKVGIVAGTALLVLAAIGSIVYKVRKDNYVPDYVAGPALEEAPEVQQMIQYAERGNSEELQKYITENESWIGRIALKEASCKGKLDAIRALVRYIEYPKEVLGNALACASTHNEVEVIKLLIDHEADINAFGVNGTTPLMEAAKAGSYDAARVLIENGADLHKHYLGQFDETALHLAVRAGHTQIIRLLLEWGARDEPGERGSAWELVDRLPSSTLSKKKKGEIKDLLSQHIDQLYDYDKKSARAYKRSRYWM